MLFVDISLRSIKQKVLRGRKQKHFATLEKQLELSEMIMLIRVVADTLYLIDCSFNTAINSIKY